MLEKTKSLQVNSHFPKEFFVDYLFEGETDSVSVNSVEFVHCLSIYGRNKSINTKLTLIYTSSEKIIKLKLEEKDIVSECNIKSMVDADVDINYAEDFNDSKVLNKCIMLSQLMNCCLTDIIRLKDGLYVNVQFTEEGLLFLIDRSLFAQLKLWIKPKNSSLLTYSYESTQSYMYNAMEDYSISSYNRDYFTRCFAPLLHASKVFLRINDKGMLCVQHMIEIDEDLSLIVDYFLIPVEGL